MTTLCQSKFAYLKVVQLSNHRISYVAQIFKIFHKSYGPEIDFQYALFQAFECKIKIQNNDMSQFR